MQAQKRPSATSLLKNEYFEPLPFLCDLLRLRPTDLKDGSVLFAKSGAYKLSKSVPMADGLRIVYTAKDTSASVPSLCQCIVRSSPSDTEEDLAQVEVPLLAEYSHSVLTRPSYYFTYPADDPHWK
eukprot:gene4355-14756_t